MLLLTALADALLFTTTTLAHKQLNFPPPFNATNNPHRTTGADLYLQYDYNCCGRNDRWKYPCHGYTSLLNTPQGAPTAAWQAGSKQSWNITGIGNHYGGSCQVGFSTNGGKTFKVTTSYEGDCPHRNGGLGPEGQDFAFTVPGDLGVGIQVFAWVRNNREQEFNMNCAAVEITAASSSYSVRSERNSAGGKKLRHPRNFHRHPREADASSGAAMNSTAAIVFDARPIMLIADDGNGCETPHTTAELKYPDPGPDVVPGDGAYPLELPNGNCGPVGRQAYHGETGEDGHPQP